MFKKILTLEKKFYRYIIVYVNKTEQTLRKLNPLSIANFIYGNLFYL